MTTIRHRRGTAAQWSASSRKLAEGEIGYETDTNMFKIGDGVSTWGELEYFINEEALIHVIQNSPDVPRRYPVPWHPVVEKVSETPILTQEDAGSPSIYWPCIVDLSDAGGTGYAVLWSTDHSPSHTESGIWLAFADDLDSLLAGDLDYRGRVYRDDAGGTQTETPSVMWSEKRGEWVMWYQMEGVPNALSTQTTLYATSPDLINWTRGGIAADWPSLAYGNDGHAGYLLTPFQVGGRYYSYALYGGYGVGGFALRTLNDDGVTWDFDRQSIPRQANLAATVTDEPLTLIGTPQTTAGGQPAAWTPDVQIKMIAGQVLLWHGRMWWVGLSGPTSAGGLVVPNEVVTAPMRDDLHGLADAPAKITPTTLSWEGVGIDGWGNSFVAENRLFYIYRAGGKQGGFGILEVK